MLRLVVAVYSITYRHMHEWIVRLPLVCMRGSSYRHEMNSSCPLISNKLYTAKVHCNPSNQTTSPNMPLAPPTSTLARQTIKIAYNELDRTISLVDKRELQNTTLQHVQKVALEIENQLAARQSLRNMRRLMPLFQGLEHYSKVVDILCNGTPYLPWIWAPITLILRVASEHVEAFDRIIKGYSSIAESLKRFEILSNAFIRQPEFQQTVAVFYADILQFHKHAYKFVRRSGEFQ